MSLSADRTRLFQSWLEEHRGIIVKVTRSFAPTPADAADLQQELMLQLWISLPGFSGQAKATRLARRRPGTWRRDSVCRARALVLVGVRWVMVIRSK